MKKNKGITIIALVITIIVLLILAGVSIATLFGSNGIISQANRAKLATEVANAKEKLEVEVLGCYETNGKLSLEKLKGNIPNIDGKIESEEFPLEVEVDGYQFEITAEGRVNSKGTVESGGSSGSSGSEGSGGGLGDTVTKEEYDKLNDTVKSLKEEIQNLKQQVNEDMTNMWKWNEINISLPMPKESWSYNESDEIPEIKDAKRVAILFSNTTWLFMDRVENSSVVMATTSITSWEPGYWGCTVRVDFSTGKIYISSGQIGSEVKETLPSITKIKYIK